MHVSQKQQSRAVIPPPVQKYLKTRGVRGPWKIRGPERENFAGAVVIPSFAEGETLWATLASLAQNPSAWLSRFLILVVVNHRSDAPAACKELNRISLEKLSLRQGELARLELAWVDASSPGCELPSKEGGVGLARKIGFDFALPRLDYSGGSPFLVSLDADTLVRPDYLGSLAGHFRSAREAGAVIPFCHQPGQDECEERAIRRYELFLRSYVLGLKRAGSPYAFHTVGSAMACTAQGYVRMGGMNRRTAAEDFYFLQHLARTGGLAEIRGTVVYPSARASCRVPFGTGRSVSRLLAGEERAVLFYRAECFQILASWLACARANAGAGAQEMLARAGEISLPLGRFLEAAGFPALWEKLRRNFPHPPQFIAAFHGWFDGLKTRKLIHSLSSGPLSCCEPEEALPGLLGWAGLQPAASADEQLALLRALQIGEAC